MSDKGWEASLTASLAAGLGYFFGLFPEAVTTKAGTTSGILWTLGLFGTFVVAVLFVIPLLILVFAATCAIFRRIGRRGRGADGVEVPQRTTAADWRKEQPVWALIVAAFMGGILGIALSPLDAGEFISPTRLLVAIGVVSVVPAFSALLLQWFGRHR